MSASLFGDDPIPATPASSTKSGNAHSSEWINAHCDGGSRGNPGPAGFGAVIVDDAGHKLTEISDFLGICSNNVAEYKGLLASLDWAIEHGYGRMRLVSDSLLMVNQIKGKFKVNSPDLRPLWEDARRKIAKFDRFEISHALRHKNKDADRLANEAMDRGTGRPAAGRPGTPKPTAAIPYPNAPGAPQPPSAPRSAAPAPAAASPSSGPKMLRGFVRDGAVHLLGGASLPDGVFVKVIVE